MHLGVCLYKVLIKADINKIDKRIIKNLEFDMNEEE